jgi:hypothetical protein
MTTTKENPVFDAFRIGIAGAIIGLALAKGFTELFDEADRKAGLAPTPDDSPKPASEKIDWAALGRSMLAQPAKTDSLSEHLKQQYLALYLIGRSGEKLNQSEIESICKDLHHFHKQLDRESDWGPAAWYETVGTSHEIPLSHRLSLNPEIKELRVDDGYIAFALGEKISDLQFGDFLSDFAELQNRGLLN